MIWLEVDVYHPLIGGKAHYITSHHIKNKRADDDLIDRKNQYKWSKRYKLAQEKKKDNFYLIYNFAVTDLNTTYLILRFVSLSGTA